MYGAWRVILQLMPKLPESSTDSSIKRAWWLLQLSNGADDARSHPEQYMALVALLWNALEHSCATTRAAAATALAQHPLDVVHELAELRPLCEVVQVCSPCCDRFLFLTVSFF